MIISHTHRFVFLEIPHTGSTAISQELRNYYGGQLILHKHANYSEFWHQASAVERKYYTFGAVRNPMDAAVTDFSKYVTNHSAIFTSPNQLKSAGGWVDEEHLARFRFVQAGASFSDYFKKFCGGIYHNWFLLRSHRYNRVMRFERLNDDFMQVLAELNITPARQLAVVNKTNRAGSFEDFYTPDIREQAVRHFGPFMKKWGYQFPESWGPRHVSMSSSVRFKTLEYAVESAASLMLVAPDNQALQRIKQTLKQLTHSNAKV